MPHRKHHQSHQRRSSSSSASFHNSIRPPTPPVDPKVSSLAARLYDSKPPPANPNGTDGEADDELEEESELSDSELFAELDKDDDSMAGLRERRLEALKNECVELSRMEKLLKLSEHVPFLI